MTITDDQALPALLRLQFALFLRFAFREIGGEGSYDHNWHIDAILHQLGRVRSGVNRRLIVTIPPRHLKSVTISTAWVAWMLGHNPALRFICVSYGQDLADKHARDCLRIMQSDWYRLAFPNLVLNRRAVNDFETSAGGGRLSTSIGGAITGRGAHIIVIDDPMKADEALSETSRATAKQWLYNTMMQRLESQEHGSIILVMQRLHQDDLAGELLLRGGWDELRLSAIATADEQIPVSSGKSYQRRTGNALHPARQPLHILKQIQAQDSYVFAAQYQQEPVPREGNMVDPSWFGRYDVSPTGGLVVQSWDTAVKTGVRNDWSVGITARYYQGRYYVLDVHRARMPFGELRETLNELCRRYRVERLLIEDTSSGQQLIQLLTKGPPAGVPLPIAIRPEGDKASRFEAQASRIQAGEVVLPQAAPWMAEFVSEIAAVPNGRHDDQADALAQMLANPPGFTGPLNAAPEVITFDDSPRLSEHDPDFDPWGAQLMVGSIPALLRRN